MSSPKLSSGLTESMVADIMSQRDNAANALSQALDTAGATSFPHAILMRVQDLAQKAEDRLDFSGAQKPSVAQDIISKAREGRAALILLLATELVNRAKTQGTPAEQLASMEFDLRFVYELVFAIQEKRQEVRDALEPLPISAKTLEELWPDLEAGIAEFLGERGHVDKQNLPDLLRGLADTRILKAIAERVDKDPKDVFAYLMVLLSDLAPEPTRVEPAPRAPEITPLHRQVVVSMLEEAATSLTTDKPKKLKMARERIGAMAAEKLWGQSGACKDIVGDGALCKKLLDETANETFAKVTATIAACNKDWKLETPMIKKEMLETRAPFAAAAAAAPAAEPAPAEPAPELPAPTDEERRALTEVERQLNAELLPDADPIVVIDAINAQGNRWAKDEGTEDWIKKAQTAKRYALAQAAKAAAPVAPAAHAAPAKPEVTDADRQALAAKLEAIVRGTNFRLAKKHLAEFLTPVVTAAEALKDLNSLKASIERATDLFRQAHLHVTDTDELFADDVAVKILAIARACGDESGNARTIEEWIEAKWIPAQATPAAAEPVAVAPAPAAPAPAPAAEQPRLQTLRPVAAAAPASGPAAAVPVAATVAATPAEPPAPEVWIVERPAAATAPVAAPAPAAPAAAPVPFAIAVTAVAPAPAAGPLTFAEHHAYQVAALFTSGLLDKIGSGDLEQRGEAFASLETVHAAARAEGVPVDIRVTMQLGNLYAEGNYRNSVGTISGPDPEAAFEIYSNALLAPGCLPAQARVLCDKIAEKTGWDAAQTITRLTQFITTNIQGLNREIWFAMGVKIAEFLEQTGRLREAWAWALALVQVKPEFASDPFYAHVHLATQGGTLFTA